MQGFSEILKQARQKQKLDIRKISRELNIRLIYLQAIENDEDISNISPVYINGYRKLYARYLGVDYNISSQQQSEVIVPKPITIESREPGKIVVLLSLLIVIFILRFSICDMDNELEISPALSNNAHLNSLYNKNKQDEQLNYMLKQVSMKDKFKKYQQPSKQPKY